jgi:hypothetical protein
MCSAPAIHREYMNPVFILSYQPFYLFLYIPELTICQETFIDRLLPACAISFEKVAHTIKTAVVCDVIGYEIKCPFHRIRIKGIANSCQQLQYCDNVSFSVVKEQTAKGG